MIQQTGWDLNRRFNKYKIRGIVFLQILEDQGLLKLLASNGGALCLFNQLNQQDLDQAIETYHCWPWYRRLAFRYRAVRRWRNEFMLSDKG